MVSSREMNSRRCSVLMIDPLIKVLKTQLGDMVEILYYMDDLKASTENVETAHAVHGIVNKYA